MKIYFTSLFLLFSLSSLSLKAINLADSSQVQQLSEVVVTAHRSEQSAFETPATIYTLNQKQLKRDPPRSVPDALFGVMGVTMQKTTQGAGSPFVRGLTGNQTLLLIDGIRLNNSTFRYGPNQYFNTIDAFTIDRVEVLAGSGSVQYGSDALGGAIQVLTIDPQLESGFSGAGTVRWASAGMERSLRLSSSYGGKAFALQGGVSLRNFGDLLGGKNTGFQTPSGYEEADFDLKAKFLLHQNLMLTVAHQNVSQQNVPAYYRYQLDNFALNVFDPQRRHLTYGKLVHQTNHRFFKEQTLTLSHQNTKEGRSSQRNGSDTRRVETDRVATLGFNLNNHSELGSKGASLNTGIELYHDRVRSERFDLDTKTNQTKLSRGLYPDGATYLNYSVYSLAQMALYKRFIATAGLRYNGFIINIPDETIGTSRLTPNALVGNIGLSAALVSHSRLFVNVSTGFRAPNVDDLGTLGIVDFRYEVPTNKLQPERALTSEIGYKLQTRRASASVSYYHTKLQDLITRVKTAQVISGLNIYQKENVERAHINGLDANVQVAIVENWELYGNVSYCFGQNETKNEPMRRIPPLNGRLGVAYQQKKWFVRSEYFFAQLQDRLSQGDKDDNRIAKGGTPAWQIVHIQGGFEAKHFGLNLRLENLFDEDYRTHGSGINGAGRSAWLTLTGKF